MQFRPRPWEIPLPEFKQLESELQGDEVTIPLAVKLSKRLNNGKDYGHAAAYLYGTWAKRVGKEAVRLHWIAYDEWQSKQSEQFDIDIPDRVSVPEKKNDLFSDPPF